MISHNQFTSSRLYGLNTHLHHALIYNMLLIKTVQNIEFIQSFAAAFYSPIRLKPGIKYFATVEACNGVLLCSKAVSHPLLADDSPPIPGLVSVGFSGDHEHYISSL